MGDRLRYFDHAATTPVFPEVVEAMRTCWIEDFGNPSSPHQLGLKARDQLDRSRSVIAASIGAREREVVFTATGTEANNLAVLGAARRQARLGKGRHVIVSTVEHPSVRNAVQQLEREGFEVSWLPVDRYGRVDPDDVRRMMRPDTVLVSVMHANNVVGTVQPVKEIGLLTRERDVLFHVDAIQSFGKIPVDVRTLNADLVSLNAHKIGGPKGVSALYIRKGVRLDPILFGGGQERGLRSGTQNVAGIVGFARAVELVVGKPEGPLSRMADLRNRLVERIRDRIPDCIIHGHPVHCLPTIVNIGIPRLEGQLLMLELDRFGFATSSGSACSASESEPSYVLLAMGKSRDEALESLRISLGWTNTEQAVDDLVDALEEIVSRFAQSRTSA